MKRKLALVPSMITLLTMALPLNIQAAEKIELEVAGAVVYSPEIPPQMEPYTKIVYLDDDNYEIIRGETTNAEPRVLSETEKYLIEKAIEQGLHEEVRQNQ